MKYAKYIDGTLEIKNYKVEHPELIEDGWKPVCESYHESDWECNLVEYPSCFVEVYTEI